MNLSAIMRIEDPSVRQVLYEDWKQDQAWKEKLEQRVRDLEQEKEQRKGSDMLKRLEYKSNLNQTVS